jgi:hypothetical protein
MAIFYLHRELGLGKYQLRGRNGTREHPENNEGTPNRERRNEAEGQRHDLQKRDRNLTAK